MKTVPNFGSAPDQLDRAPEKATRTAISSGNKKSKRQGHMPRSSRKGSDTTIANLVAYPDGSDIRTLVCQYAESEAEALAMKTLQLAKRGHKGALAFVYESLDELQQATNAITPLDLGIITRLDEIADAQRIVILATTEGRIKPRDAVHYMKMLNELGEAIKNTELQAEIDELRSYVHGA